MSTSARAFTTAHFSHHISNSLLNPLLPFIRDSFQLTYGQSGWLVSAFAVSLGLSAVFLWIAVRGVSWQETSAALRAARIVYLPPIFIIAVISLYFRALRWGVLLRPLARVERRSLFSATAIGFAANMLLPLRAGEVIRPWLLARKEGLTLAPLLATVAIERLFDMAILLLFFAVATLTLPLPPEWKHYGWVFLGTFVLFLGPLKSGSAWSWRGARRPCRRPA